MLSSTRYSLENLIKIEFYLKIFVVMISNEYCFLVEVEMKNSLKKNFTERQLDEMTAFFC